MPRNRRQTERKICFVTGTRAEFGLMEKTLRAISTHPNLKLQLIVTGMHLDRGRGNTVRIVEKNWQVNHIVPWDAKSNDPVRTATATGVSIAKLAYAFNKLKTDVVLIVGDRVEAFAAASAAHISGKIVAHVHGGDRALGQVDDALRHAITKLSHIHFPATKASANRIEKLGEVRKHIHCVGSPGIEGIADVTRLGRISAGKRVWMLVLHPTSPDDDLEYRRAKLVLAALSDQLDRLIIVYPNNDPGSNGIIRAWKEIEDRTCVLPNVDRLHYLGMLNEAGLLIGNSSSGIIEAGSFGLPVVDIGTRQLGRERGSNVVNVPYSVAAIRKAIGKARRRRIHNIYDGGKTSRKIAGILASLRIDDQLQRKLIAY